jgi:hypothetical protein
VTVSGVTHPSGYVTPRLRDAWEHGRQRALAGADLRECPHRTRNGLREYSARLAWFEGHARGRQEVEHCRAVAEPEVERHDPYTSQAGERMSPRARP